MVAIADADRFGVTRVTIDAEHRCVHRERAVLTVGSDPQSWRARFLPAVDPLPLETERAEQVCEPRP